MYCVIFWFVYLLWDYVNDTVLFDNCNENGNALCVLTFELQNYAGTPEKVHPYNCL